MHIETDHIDHVRLLAGVDHVGLGSDYNGVDEFPPGMEDESSYPKIIAQLLQEPYRSGQQNSFE